jgi:hypothetical protein
VIAACLRADLELLAKGIFLLSGAHHGLLWVDAYQRVTRVVDVLNHVSVNLG